MRNQGIDILGLVDHKITQEDNNIQQIDYDIIITSSARRNNANVAVRGAGLVVSKYGENTLAEIIRYTQYRNSNG